MKKVFSIWYWTVLSVLRMGTFSSCDKQVTPGDDVGGSIVGKWFMKEVNERREKEVITDGTFYDLKADETFLHYEGGEYGVGDWRHANGKLEMIYDYDKTEELYLEQGFVLFIDFAYTIVKLTDKTLVISITI